MQIVKNTLIKKLSGGDFTVYPKVTVNFYEDNFWKLAGYANTHIVDGNLHADFEIPCSEIKPANFVIKAFTDKDGTLHKILLISPLHLLQN